MEHFVYPTGGTEAIPVQDLFGELLAEAVVLEGLTPLEQLIWASGALASWRDEFRSDDPSGTDRALAEWLRSNSDSSAALFADAIDRLLDRTAEVAFDGAWRVGPTWLLSARYEGEAFSLLVDCEGTELQDFQIGPPAEALLDALTADRVDGEGSDTEPLPSPVGVEVEAALEAVVSGWSELAERMAQADEERELPETLILNQVAVRSWISGRSASAATTRSSLADLIQVARPHLTFNDGLSSAEVADGNAWASGVIRSALRRSHKLAEPSVTARAGESSAEVAAFAVPLIGPIGHLHRREQQALCWLEWADWLGVILGLARIGSDSDEAGALVTPESMLAHLRSCQEVTSEVPEADEEWMRYAFEVAVAVWADADLVVWTPDGPRLTASAREQLVVAALWAWSGSAEAGS